MHPRHVVMATGLSGAPSIPDIPRLDNFAGPVLHSSQYDEGEAWRGKRALVIGSGNSGHDIAQDLHASGAKVTLVQRSSTMVVNVEPSAQLPYALYDEGPPLEDCDLITLSVPLALARKSHKLLTEKAKQIDQELARRARSARASGSTSATTAPAGSSNISPAAAAITSMSAAPISSSKAKSASYNFPISRASWPKAPG